jgi:hypothetical protein
MWVLVACQLGGVSLGVLSLGHRQRMNPAARRFDVRGARAPHVGS